VTKVATNSHPAIRAVLLDEMSVGPPCATPGECSIDAFYQRLRTAGTGDVQLVEAPDPAGGGMLTLAVDDLPAHVDDVRERGDEVEPIDDTTSDKVLFVTVTDPDGNAVTLVEQRI
jgi:catechol 2,3-dioxygenase-like lactoylglutathione lyase family enzyme